MNWYVYCFISSNGKPVMAADVDRQTIIHNHKMDKDAGVVTGILALKPDGSGGVLEYMDAKPKRKKGIEELPVAERKVKVAKAKAKLRKRGMIFVKPEKLP
jgi:hypothetical protein